MSRALAEISGLSVHYTPTGGKPVLALDNVSLSISQGEVVGILGESGSGKSTLAAAIMRLLPARTEVTGCIFFEDRDLMSMSERELCAIRGRRISLIAQDPAIALNPVIRVGTQISEVMRAHLNISRNERKQNVQELLCEVGFDDPDRIARAYPHQLSGGQRQRVVIAQAITCQPSLVIADESTSKLDPSLQIQILEVMSRIRRRHGTAMLWISHDPATLAGFADRIVVMHQGRIVELGETNQILHRPQHAYTQKLVGLARELSLDAPMRRGQLEYAN